MRRHSQVLWAEEQGQKPDEFRLSKSALRDLARNTAKWHSWELVAGRELAAERILSWP